jgi:hypothetical protein
VAGGGGGGGGEKATDHKTAPKQQRQLPEVVPTQFHSPADEHDVVETCRELKVKINT